MYIKNSDTVAVNKYGWLVLLTACSGEYGAVRSDCGVGLPRDKLAASSHLRTGVLRLLSHTNRDLLSWYFRFANTTACPPLRVNKERKG
jgi:hypothetical protein